MPMRPFFTNGQRVTPVWTCDTCGSHRRPPLSTSCEDCAIGVMMYEGNVRNLVLLPWEEKAL